MEHFGAEFEPDLMEETRTQLQQEEAIAKVPKLQKQGTDAVDQKSKMGHLLNNSDNS